MATNKRANNPSSAASEAQADVTTDHEEIRRWVEERQGRPACVKSTESDESCLLRIDYPDYSGEETLEAISWDEFFRIFDDNKLAFLHQDQTKAGDTSRFAKFIERGAAESGGGYHGRSAQ